MSNTMQFTQLPSALPAYKKAVTDKKTGIKGDATIPRLEASINNLAVDQAKLNTYCKVCGFQASDSLPVSFLHIFASPLHMQLLTAKNFPLKLLGLVHVRNSITQHRAVKTHEEVNIKCWIEGHRDVSSGIEFDICSEVTVGDEVVWESVSTNLSRQAKKGGKKKSTAKKELPSFDAATEITIPSGKGREYAKVSGDFNPIHMWDVTAKLLGFNKAIIHGMWTLARGAAEMQGVLPEKLTYTTEFKLPIFMPAKVSMKYSRSDNGIEMLVTDKNGKKPHMAAQFSF